jgi:hypothetical protein
MKRLVHIFSTLANNDSASQAAGDYSIEHAKQIKDWPALETVVDAKVEEQGKFVAWWHGNIRSQGDARKKAAHSAFFLF